MDGGRRAVVSLVAPAAVVLAGGWTLFAARRGRVPTSGVAVVDAPAIARALFVMGGVLACALFASMTIGLGPFGAIRLWYLGLVVGIPVLGAAVFSAHAFRRGGRPVCRASRGALALATVALLMAPVGAWASFVEPHRLVLERPVASIAAARTGSEPLRIGVLADIQCDAVGDHERAAVSRVLAEKPDVVLLPGDLFQGTPEEFERALPALRDLLRPVSAPGGAYFVEGDVDTPNGLRRATQGSGIRVLADEIVEVRVRDRRVRICGLASTDRDSLDLLARFAGEPGDDDVRIVVVHRPGAVLALDAPSRIDLVVAGHTHGGQFQVPFFGPLMTLTSVPRAVAAGGLHDLDGRRIYVSRGIGMERRQAPRFRFNCPPEVTLLTLQSGRAD